VLRRVALGVVLPLLAVAACTSSTTAPRAHSTPSVSPSTALPAGIVISVQRSGRRIVELYRVDASRHAVLLKRLSAPRRDQTAGSVTIAAGEHPDACVTWETTGEDGSIVGGQLRCYAFADRRGRLIPMSGTPDSVALRPDGRVIFWIVDGEAPPGGQHVDLVTASYHGGSVSDLQVHPSVRDGKAVQGFGCDAGSGAWAGDDTVLLACPDSIDFDYGIVVQPLRGRGRTLDHPAGRVFYGGDSADATSALVLEGADCTVSCPGSDSSSRAVRVDLLTGRVLEVIAVPAKGRSVDSVSGGERGIFYVTEGAKDSRAYLRLPGEKHGVRVTGLPADSWWLVAQP